MSRAQIEEALDACLPAAAGRLVVAYSGGLDSTVLLHAAAARRPGQVSALHINHGLQSDANHWQRHCERCCAHWKIALRCQRVQVVARGEGPEAAARKARYRCFENALGPGDSLLLGHHLDDQVETLLLRLLRGAGLDGLAGMPQRRPLGAGNLLRPLLSLPRAVLTAYAQEFRLSWIDDPSNGDSRLDRNYLRHRVLPLIEARWPAYRRTLGRAATRLGEAAEALPTAALAARYSVIGDPGFALSSLPEPPLDALAIRGWLRGLGLRAPPALRLQTFLEQLREASGAQLCADGWVLERYRDAVFCRCAAVTPPSGVLPIVPGQALRIDGVGLVRLRPVPGLVAQPPLPLQLRFRRGGERLALADGHHRRLKTLLQDLAVPPWWRDRLPLLYSGDALLAVGPLCRAPQALRSALKLDWEPALMCSRGDLRAHSR